MKRKFNELEARYLNLLTDFGFHKIFGNESNKDLLIDFLNQVIKEEGLIANIQIQPPECFGNLKTDRRAVFDIFCTTENGEYFIVEMQKAKQVFFRDRSIFYASLPIQQQAKKGIWNFHLKKVYFVAILDFILFDECEDDKEQIVEYVCLMRESTKTIFSNKLKFAFIELPKFRKTEEELETHFDKWLYILKNLPNLKNRPKSVKGEIFDKVFELVDMKQLTLKDMGRYRKSVADYYDVQLCMDCAREEGREEVRKSVADYHDVQLCMDCAREEGREKGHREGVETVIQKCLQKNMAIEDIIFITGFSKEQIKHYSANGTL